MDVRHIRYFVAAVEEGSLQGAAARLHIAQPALSRRIRDLEASLGCELLFRGPRGVVPTRAGASLYRDALTILGQLDNARQRTRLLGREDARLVRLGLMPSARKYAFLGKAVGAFRSSAAAGAISYTRASSADIAQQLRDGALDLAFLYERRMANPAMRERLVHEERYVLALHPGHALAGRAAPPLTDLAGEPLVWLARQDDVDHHDLLMQQCRLHGLEPLIAQTAHSPEEQVDLAVIGGGAFLTPASTMLSTPPGMLVFRPLPDLAMSISLVLAWRTPDAGQGALLLTALNAAIDRHQAALRARAAPWPLLDGHRVVNPPAHS